MVRPGADRVSDVDASGATCYSASLAPRRERFTSQAPGQTPARFAGEPPCKWRKRMQQYSYEAKVRLEAWAENEKDAKAAAESASKSLELCNPLYPVRSVAVNVDQEDGKSAASVMVVVF